MVLEVKLKLLADLADWLIKAFLFIVSCLLLTSSPPSPAPSPHQEMKALVLIANGSEETEATATCDILTRGEIEVTRASVGVPVGEPVHCAYGMRVVSEVRLEELTVEECLKKFDVIILPGGRPGTKTFTQVTV